MHKAGILDEVRERVGRNRGGIAVFDQLTPRRTAHIVVDLQNGFMGQGQVAEVPMARAIVPNVNRISATLRAAGGLVVYTQHTADAEAIRTWPVFFEHARLQERGIDTLIISGTVSQVCCEATARDAMMMNYKVFFISDACATLTDAEQGGTLSAMAHTFCDVRDTQSMLGLIATV